jgi:hypothetical protein
MALVPRPDQVAELTRGVRLPLPAVALPLLIVIVAAIREAWECLVALHGTALYGKSEPELTALLQSRLNDLRNNSRKLGQIVSGVVRGAESVSYDGRHIEKRPDLSIFMTTRNANFPLVAECKVIDYGLSKGIDLYCNHGVRRFVEGEYGWASTQAFMIGYVCDQSSIEGKLIPYLQAAAGTNSDPFKTKGLQRQEQASEPQVVSEHDRAFRYLNAPANDDPGPIVISHLWVGVPRQS